MGEGSSSYLLSRKKEVLSGKKEVKRSVLYSRDRERDRKGSARAFSQQQVPANKWACDKELQPAVHAHARLHSPLWMDKQHLKIIKYLLVLEWTTLWRAKVNGCLLLSRCVHTCMQPYKSPFLFSLSFNVARAPQHAMHASMVSAISFLRTRQTANSSCKYFQLIPTGCNCFQLSFSCLLLGCTMDLTGCDCLQLLATTLICLLLSCVVILTSCNWLQLLSASFKYIHSLAVWTWLQLLPTCFSYLQKLSVCFSSLQFFEFSASFQVANFTKIFQNKLDI